MIMKITYLPIAFFCFLLCFACHSGQKIQKPTPPEVARVEALLETPPVPALTGKDAADDPAIWVHPSQPRNSLVIGTVKHYGLEVYDLQGKLRKSYQIGNPNNVDLRYDFTLKNGKKVDFIAFSDRATNQVAIYFIDPEKGELIENPAPRIQSKLTEVYGICLYRSAKSGLFYVFVNGKDGAMEQYQLAPEGEAGIGGQLVRTFKVKTQPEGLVADDQLGFVYLGEEDKGIWKLAAEPDAPTTFTFLAESVPAVGRPIQYDIEGLAIFPTGPQSGYLIASSQGNNTYAVFDRTGNNRYLGSFAVGDNRAAGVDGVGDTDGLDVTARNLGGAFGQGMLVVQDGFNVDSTGRALPQNFKLVPWAKIQSLLKR
jgi:3-phytase